jgi:hypothetical protein
MTVANNNISERVAELKCTQLCQEDKVNLLIKVVNQDLILHSVEFNSLSCK